MPRAISAVQHRLAAPSWIVRSVLALSVLAAPFGFATAQETSQKDSQDADSISRGRALLENLGVERDVLDSLENDLPLEGAQVDTIARLIAAVRKARPYELDPLAESLPVSNPDPSTWQSFSGKLFDFEGRATRVSVVPPISIELADGLKLPKLYRCEIACRKAGGIVVVYTPGVPKAWPLDRQLDEPVRGRGFFARLARNDSANGDASPSVWRPVLAAARVAWHPPSRLGELGMDMGLFDLTRPRTRLAADEAECFYSLLSAVGRSKPGELTEAAAGKTYPLLPLLSEPHKHAGELAAFTGTASRALLVRADDELKRRFGIEYHFQVEMDVELEQPVLWNGKPYRRFPLVALVRELPPRMPIGEDIHANVRVAGYYYSTWDYRSGAADDSQKTDQFAPLIVARDLVWIEPRVERDSTAAIIAGSIFALAVVGGWFVYWRASRNDRKFRERLYDRTRTGAGESDGTILPNR